MTNLRDEVLRATAEASGILEQYPATSRTSFDVQAVLIDRDIPMLYRPLKRVLGATITIDDATGIIVTTQQPFTVQRFTLAHELGHILLGHKMRFDEAVGQWMARRGGPRSAEEVAADTFASELLAPQSRLLGLAARHQWTMSDVRKPQIIYQLSLRLGISFQATCWALAGNKVIPREEAKRLSSNTVVKGLKTSLAGSMLTDPWADVWRITQQDVGAEIEAGPNDIFAVAIQDLAASGYRWSLESPSQDYQVIDQQILLDETPGSPTPRTLYVKLSSQGTRKIELTHKRPWNQETASRFDIIIDNWGKENGLPRRTRMMALSGAGA